MDHKAAKELLHVRGWLERVDDIVERGKDAYLADDLLQEAGDSCGLCPVRRGWWRTLVGYAKDDLMVPQAPFTDLVTASTAATAWCAAAGRRWTRWPVGRWGQTRS